MIETKHTPIGSVEERINEVLHLRAINAELLEALKTMRDIRHKQWQASAGTAFVKGQVALPWPDIQMAEAAIRKAEGGQ